MEWSMAWHICLVRGKSTHRQCRQNYIAHNNEQTRTTTNTRKPPPHAIIITLRSWTDKLSLYRDALTRILICTATTVSVYVFFLSFFLSLSYRQTFSRISYYAKITNVTHECVFHFHFSFHAECIRFHFVWTNFLSVLFLYLYQFSVYMRWTKKKYRLFVSFRFASEERIFLCWGVVLDGVRTIYWRMEK